MTSKVYVGNLSYDTTDNTLRTLFSEFGAVESVNIVTDRDTGRPRGFAFVEMADNQAAQVAINALNGKSVDGREIKVNEAKPRPERDNRRPGGGGGDRRGGGGGGGGDRRRPRW
jgi:cold-inducible RNA-binding protein